MLLVGGFSESKYLQTRIEQEFNQKLANKISVPAHPIAAIVKGGNLNYTLLHVFEYSSIKLLFINSQFIKSAVQFGLRPEVAATRVLKWTYGNLFVKTLNLCSI